MVRKFIVTVNGKSYEVEVEELQKNNPQILVNTEPVEVKKQVELLKPVQAVKPQQPTQSTPSASAATQAKDTANGFAVTAPMPGTILEVKVIVDTQVSKGQVLVVLEAMKMENEIVAPKDGKVGTIKAVKGSPVNAGDVLITLL